MTPEEEASQFLDTCSTVGFFPAEDENEQPVAYTIPGTKKIPEKVIYGDPIDLTDFFGELKRLQEKT